MAGHMEQLCEEEAVLIDAAAAASPRRYRKPVLFVAGGVAAAAALVALGVSGRASLRGAAVENNSVVKLAEEAPLRKSRAGFIANSQPFKGGRNGALDADEHGGVMINEDGVENMYYLPGAITRDGGKTVMYEPPYRFYLMKKPTTDYSNADNFYKPLLAGKTFTVDMKVTGVGCGCNVNFFLVDMPWPQPGEDNDHYCDAQCFDGLGCCAEFDMCEGNANVLQVTNHACTSDYEGHSDWECHQEGSPMAKTVMEDFNMGRRGFLDSIDGNKPFTFAQEFRVLPDDQLQVITTVTQGDKKVTKTMGPSTQLQAMYKTGSLEKGMAFVTGYWHDEEMNWLDSDSCGMGPESCSMMPAYISNWRITTTPYVETTTTKEETTSREITTKLPMALPVVKDNFRCCYNFQGESCHEKDNWCSQSHDNCAECKGQFESWHCCYGDGFTNCKASDDFCAQSGTNCGKCSGNWRAKGRGSSVLEE